MGYRTPGSFRDRHGGFTAESKDVYRWERERENLKMGTCDLEEMW